MRFPESKGSSELHCSHRFQTTEHWSHPWMRYAYLASTLSEFLCCHGMSSSNGFNIFHCKWREFTRMVYSQMQLIWLMPSCQIHFHCVIVAAYTSILLEWHWHGYFVFFNNTRGHFFLTQIESENQAHNLENIMLKIASFECYPDVPLLIIWKNLLKEVSHIYELHACVES